MVALPTAARVTSADQRDQTVRATVVPAAREDRRTVGMVHRTVTVRREASPIVVRADPVDSDPVVLEVPMGAVGLDLGLAVPVDSAAEAVGRLGKFSRRRSSMN